LKTLNYWLTELGSRRRAVQEDAAVHFHRGPHGEPSPCYDERCDVPQLAHEDF
jgi:hypothetical protein